MTRIFTSLRFFLFPLILLIPAFAQGKTIAVIGGGLAGLTTAYELQKLIDANPLTEKVTLHLYEAKERLGGRVFTVHLEGKPAELGGENINDGGEALHIRRVAKELGLKIKSRKTSLYTRVYFDPSSKKEYKIEELKPYFPKITQKQLVKTLAEGEKRSKNLGQVLDFFFSKYPALTSAEKKHRLLLRKAIAGAMQSYEGGEVGQLSVRYAHGSLAEMMMPFLAGYKPEPYATDSIEGGNSNLVLALAQKLKGRIQMNRPLVEIKKSSLGFELRFESQGTTEKIYADIVVLAIPGKPYGNIQFGDGTIDPQRLEAIKTISYASHAKILVPAPPPEEYKMISTPGVDIWRQSEDSWYTLYFHGEAGLMKNQSDLKNGFNLANQALPASQKMTLKNEIQVPIKIFSEYQEPVAMAWTQDPFIQASYSFFTPRMREQLEKTVLVDGIKVLPLFLPIDRKIFFAGEHTTTDQDIRGTMEAAVGSGDSAAKLVWAAIAKAK